MYIPKYKINNQILRNIGNIEVAKEIIENAPIVPAWEAKFRDEAKLRSAHYGTALEGNDLTMGEAKMIIEREIDSIDQASASGLVARDRDVQEVINYRRVIEYLETMAPRSVVGKPYLYSSEMILQIHKRVVERVVDSSKSGIYRQTQVVLKNSITGEIGFRPPVYTEVPFLMDELLRWLNSDFGKQDHPVIRSAISHYVLAAVHPFVEGNGRTARAFAMLVLYVEGYDVKRFLALEEYFDSHADEYFGSLMEVSNQSNRLEERDLTPWIETFSKALAHEMGRIKEKVKELSLDLHVKQKMGHQVALSERQMKIMEYLRSNGELSMADARSVLPMVSEDTILRDLKSLIEQGVISKKGSTKAARYVSKRSI